HNHYGPTETHAATALTIAPEGEIPTLPSIGYPLANEFIYIVDKQYHLNPIGIAGQLIIGGAQVGRGYLNQPSLTAERFTKSFSGVQGAAFQKSPLAVGDMVYETGDLARWLEDGKIEFLGRIDSQVKVRGFRVELGEIESLMLGHPDVKEAAVVIKSGDVLCAYFVSGREMRAAELTGYLSGTLPDYMVPAYFVPMGVIPLNVNGKVDRSALPEPQLDVGVEFVAPGNPLEIKLAELWAEVLEV
ncbi:MAG: AMP-binding protein, partial [bacterium]|nr:AMP-binding protein [bacterium]